MNSAVFPGLQYSLLLSDLILKNTFHVCFDFTNHPAIPGRTDDRDFYLERPNSPKSVVERLSHTLASLTAQALLLLIYVRSHSLVIF
jgi:hypothetical protein